MPPPGNVIEKVVAGLPDKEQAFLLLVLADYLNCRKTQQLPNEIDWTKLLNLAKNHEASGILYHQLHPLLSAQPALLPVAQFLEKANSAYLVGYRNRLWYVEQIKAALQQQRIPFLIFKGIELAAYYPVPYLRSMGDTDILVHPADRKRVDAILQQLGMENLDKGSAEWVYSVKNMLFELHAGMMDERELTVEPQHAAFLHRAWRYAVPVDGFVQHRLDISYHFVFVLLHLRKHLLNCGVGFRQFMDVAMLAQQPQLDWQWIGETLAELQITAFAQSCLALCEKWFQLSLPGEKAVLQDHFYQTATEQIFANGVFGETNAQNDNNRVIQQISANRNRVGLVLRNFMVYLFPARETLCLQQEFTYLRKRPFLLPFAWIARIISSVRRKNVSSALDKATRGATVTQTQVDARNQYLQQWGID